MLSGGFDYGTGTSYNGTRLAARGNIVVVSTNYRLGERSRHIFALHTIFDPYALLPCASNDEQPQGPFGFLQHPQILAETGGTTLGGMNGLLDTLLALRWTHANVDRFGGDATRLTIGGESAGAVATCMHAHSPLSAGLYAQLVMESGDCTGPW